MPSASALVEKFLAEAEKGDAYVEAGWLPPDQRSREVNRAADEAICSMPRPLASTVIAEEGLALDSDLKAKLDHGVFFWEFEQALFGKLLPVYNQTIGDCVSMGAARAAQDALVIDAFIAGGLLKTVKSVATEPIYAGSRVEVGKGRLSGDGSLGVWAAKWVTDWGILLREKYGDIDLTTYSGNRARDWGRRGAGCPDSIEDDAKLHPIPETTLVTSADQAIPILANLNPITVASNVGYERRRRPNGICRRSGRWNHQMMDCGVANGLDGNPYIPERNSWGDYLGDTNNVFTTASGREVVLPPGVFMRAAEDAEVQYRQQDSWGFSSPLGWKARPSGLLVQNRVGHLAAVAQHLAA